jgi:hypothetical protein
MDVWMYGCMYVCMDVWMNVCMYVCMYVCEFGAYGTTAMPALRHVATQALQEHLAVHALKATEQSNYTYSQRTYVYTPEDQLL